MSIPAAFQLRKMIDEAKSRHHDKQRAAAKDFITRFTSHLNKLVSDPSKFTSHTVYSEEVKGDMYTSGADSDFFFDSVKGELAPLGYRVERSHDGGGMYSTIVVRWDIETRKRNYGDVGPPYAPETK